MPWQDTAIRTVKMHRNLSEGQGNVLESAPQVTDIGAYHGDISCDPAASNVVDDVHYQNRPF